MSGNNELRLSVDHLLIASPDLQLGCDFAEQQFGIRPVVGGSHPGMGTCNALLGLRNNIYIEIIAPDPDQDQASLLSQYLKSLALPSLKWWAVKCSNLQALESKLKAANIEIVSIHPGSRILPDGRELKWNLLIANDSVLGGCLPFFIEWQDMNLHPSVDLPLVGDLSSLEIHHPHSERLLSVLDSDFNIFQSNKMALKAVIDTGDKIITLSSTEDHSSGIGCFF